MNNNTVMVSVILLIQQESVYLTECIDSIVSQSFDDWELICVAVKHDKASQDTIRMYMEAAGQPVLGRCLGSLRGRAAH